MIPAMSATLLGPPAASSLAQPHPGSPYVTRKEQLRPLYGTLFFAKFPASHARSFPKSSGTKQQVCDEAQGAGLTCDTVTKSGSTRCSSPLGPCRPHIRCLIASCHDAALSDELQKRHGAVFQPVGASGVCVGSTLTCTARPSSFTVTLLGTVMGCLPMRLNFAWTVRAALLIRGATPALKATAFP